MKEERGDYFLKIVPGGREGRAAVCLGEVVPRALSPGPGLDRGSRPPAKDRSWPGRQWALIHLHRSLDHFAVSLTRPLSNDLTALERAGLVRGPGLVPFTPSWPRRPPHATLRSQGHSALQCHLNILKHPFLPLHDGLPGD